MHSNLITNKIPNFNFIFEFSFTSNFKFKSVQIQKKRIYPVSKSNSHLE